MLYSNLSFQCYKRPTSKNRRTKKPCGESLVNDKGNSFIFTYYLDSNKQQFYSQTVSTNLKDKQKGFMMEETIFGYWPSRDKKEIKVSLPKTTQSTKKPKKFIMYKRLSFIKLLVLSKKPIIIFR